MAEKTLPASPKPVLPDLALEAVGGALSSATLAVVLGLAGPWLLVSLLGTQNLENIELTLFGALLGLVLGAALGAWLVARSRKQRFSLGLAVGGSLLGAALSTTLPTLIAGSEGSSATPWVAAVMCTLGAVVFGNLKTWMNR